MADEVAGLLASKFDGKTNYQTRNDTLTGVIDGKKYLVSVWVIFDAGEGNNDQIIFELKGSSFKIAKTETDTIKLSGKQQTVGDILEQESTIFITNDEWHHILISGDMDAVGTVPRKIYIDGIDVTSETLHIDGDFQYTKDDTSISASINGGAKFAGSQSELYVNFAACLDITDPDVVLLFRNVEGRPVFLGDYGEIPTGIQPIIYTPNGNCEENFGFGGNFTTLGTLYQVVGPGEENLDSDIPNEFVVEFSPEEYNNLLSYSKTHTESYDISIHTYKDLYDVEYEVVIFNTKAGIRWDMNNGDTVKYTAKTVYIPDMDYITYSTDNFMEALTGYLNLIPGDTHDVVLKDYRIIHTSYSGGPLKINEAQWKILNEDIDSYDIKSYINLKIQGLNINLPAPKEDKKLFVFRCQNFCRCTLVFTTDTTHPHNIEWLNLSRRVSEESRLVPPDPTEDEMKEFNTKMDGFIEEVKNLLLPGEVF